MLNVKGVSNSVSFDDKEATSAADIKCLYHISINWSCRQFTINPFVFAFQIVGQQLQWQTKYQYVRHGYLVMYFILFYYLFVCEYARSIFAVCIFSHV
jgi:hypothetical protein